jgi:hypothetical protein
VPEESGPWLRRSLAGERRAAPRKSKESSAKPSRRRAGPERGLPNRRRARGTSGHEPVVNRRIAPRRELYHPTVGRQSGQWRHIRVPIGEPLLPVRRNVDLARYPRNRDEAVGDPRRSWTSDRRRRGGRDRPHRRVAELIEGTGLRRREGQRKLCSGDAKADQQNQADGKRRTRSSRRSKPEWPVGHGYDALLCVWMPADAAGMCGGGSGSAVKSSRREGSESRMDADSPGSLPATRRVDTRCGRQ